MKGKNAINSFMPKVTRTRSLLFADFAVIIAGIYTGQR